MKKRVLLIAGVCILLLIGVFTFYWLTNNGYETGRLPSPDRLFTINTWEEARIDGEFTIVSKYYMIPEDTELFSEYSTLLSALELRPARWWEKSDSPISCLITYVSGGTEGWNGVRLEFGFDENAADLGVSITIEGKAPAANTVYKIGNVEEWREALLELLEKSEEYREE